MESELSDLLPFLFLFFAQVQLSSGIQNIAEKKHVLNELLDFPWPTHQFIK